ncbi:MAG: DUF1295 domain-containing protein, partial [Myxococcota bacterium]
WGAAAGACTLGLLFTAAIVLPAPPTGRGFAADVFLGRWINPRAYQVDAKMFLYLVGAVMLELNLLSSCAHHLEAHPGAASPGVLAYTVMFSWFVCEYLWFEEVHLYTYDLFAERVGFKLGWGCLAFYPFFYPIGGFAAAADADPGTPIAVVAVAGGLFVGGWTLARGANLQKFTFKVDPTRSFLGIRPEVLTDGTRSLVVNGFWGVSRHVNYLGEIAMASGLALALAGTGGAWPWAYPLYYVLLLFPRERDDDRRCAAKYGPLWDQYRARVRYRIVPGIY